MPYFLPGEVVKKISLKHGNEAVIRYPKWEDLDTMTTYINLLSREDTYLTCSGETISKEGEMYYLTETFKGMERGDSLYLACFVGDIMAGSCTINRDLLSRKRSYHVGIFGITMVKEFRSQGIGFELSQATIEEAKQKISGLRMLILNVYSPNKIAQNLYKKLGFKEAGRIPQSVWYRGDYIDEIKMYKQL